MSSKAALGKLAGKKIDSPLAKYNSTGQLYCVLCNTPVKNEIYWTGHVNGKSHREQLLTLKSKNKREISEESKSASPSPFKRVKFADDSDFAVPLPPPPKQNVSTPPKLSEPLNLHNFASVQARISQENGIFDEEMEEENETKPVTKVSSASKLPEGFFDDPKEDAKARGVEYRDPKEVEWEKFVKEIASEEIKSTALRSVDEEESTFSRDLDEIEEQMAHWQRVIELEKKAQETKQQQSKNSESSTNAAVEDDDEIEYDEDLDWRSKNH